MIRVAMLVLSASLVSGPASAQVYDRRGYDPETDDRYRAARAGQLDEARVIRVDPVFGQGAWRDGGGSGMDRGVYRESGYGRDDRAGDGDFGDDHYVRSGYPGDDYRGDGYAVGRDPGGPYAPSRCQTRRDDGYVDSERYSGGGYRGPEAVVGTEGGRTMATVIGGVLGAVVGSQVGGGSGRFATSAIGTMVGGIAGREVYEAGQRDRVRGGEVTVCDPVPVADGRGYGYGATAPAAGIEAYDVTYEYAGRQYTTRTRYHPGDTLRVRVQVTPDD